MPRGTFRVNRKKVGLTWSCPVDADENPIADAKIEDIKIRNMTACEKIKTFFTEKDQGQFQHIIAWENHKTGKVHFHAYLNYDVALDISNERWFDIDGVHPNIIKPGKGWISYITKDGIDHYISNVQQSVFSMALMKRTAAEALDYLWDHDPKSMALQAHNIETNIRKRMKYSAPVTRYEGPFNMEYLTNIKSVILKGPAGVGKTQYAKSQHHFKNPLFVSHLDGLKRFNNEHDGIIFDDMDFKHLPRTTQIHLVDWDDERDIHVRYGTVLIPAHTPKIFTCNMDCLDVTDSAIARRVTIITIG